MLASASRRALILLLAVLACAPLVAASLSPDDRIDSAEQRAGGYHPWIQWTIDEANSHRPGGSDGGGQGGSGPDDGQGDGSGGSGDGSSGAGSQSPLEPAHPVVILLLHEADGVLDGVPANPVGLLGDKIKPVQQTAEALPAMLLPPPDGDASPPAPATASIVAVAPDNTVPLLVAGATAAAAAAVAILWLAGSSGSLGAGAAGASSAKGLAGTDLRRLLPFASPLFTRFEKDTVLGHPKREALYALILQDPGVSLQSLCDSTGLSRTAVTHHLRLMELQHLIVSKRMGRSRHYYENGGRFGRDQKDAYAVLQNDRSKAVADFVKQNPGAIQKVICAAVGVQASVAHWHLRRLQEALLVEAVRNGRTVAYYPGVGLKGMALPPLPAMPSPAPAALPLTV